MDVPPEMLDLGVRLTESVARNTATAVADKVRLLRTGAKQEQIIAGLEEIISDLIADKAEVTRIAQSYQEQLVSQRLTDADVEYVADTVVPLLSGLAAASGEDGASTAETIEQLKPLLSAEMVQVLQILGFNFRQAVGEPLTKLAEQAILSKQPRSEELQLEAVRKERAYIELALDPEAFARFRSLFPAP